MQQAGLNAESRPSDPPLQPAPPTFVVTEQRNDSGDLAVIPVMAEPVTQPPLEPVTQPTLALLAAFTNDTGGPGAQGAFVDTAMLTTSGVRGSQQLDAFSVPAAATFTPASGNFSGMSGAVDGVPGVQDQTQPNPVGAYWGTWFAGGATDASGTTTFSSSNILHYLVGPLTPPEVIAAKSGAIAFLNVQGTLPTSSAGGPAGTFSANGPWTVNFTTRDVTATDGFGMSFQNQTWFFNQFSAKIQTSPGRGAFIDTTASGSCSGAMCAVSTSIPATASVKGTFLGPVGDHLGVAINARAGSASAQTVQIFSCAPSC